jgi:dipeptidyl-peptidase-4
MKNKFFLPLLFLFPAIIISAQTKILTTENCVFGAQEGFTPQRLTQLGWIKGTDDYYFIDKTSGIETLVSANATAKGAAKKIITLTELNDLLRNLHVTAVGDQKSFPVITWESSSSFSFEIEKSKFHYSTSGKKLTADVKSSVPDKAENMDASAKGNVAYTIDNNLFIHFLTVGTGGQMDLPITNDAEINIVNGKSVHREEFGISKGTFWSPDGSLLAFYRMDQTMVTDYPIMDLTKQPAQARVIKYPMAGGTSHEVTVGIYNLTTSKTIFLKTGEPKDQYLTNIAWSPDNKFVYIAVLNRDQNHLWLNRYNAETGAFDKTLFEETDPKYVHPMHPMQFVPGHNDEFIWQRELCTTGNTLGMNAIFLYNTDGKSLKQLTVSATEDCNNCNAVTVTDIYGFDAKGTMLYYQAAPIGSCDREVFVYDLTKDNTLLLSRNEGTNAAIFPDDKKYFINTYSALANPGIQSVYDLKQKEVKVLLQAANPLVQIDATDPMRDAPAPNKNFQVKLFTITAADNETKLWCRMILPAGFDSTKKYKTLTYVYNGPNVQLVTNSWIGGADLFLIYMAQQGFIVFTVDGRGSDGRGMKFEQATFQHLGTQEIADQEKGSQYLKALKYVDATRMAVYGWSFGGFMTTSLMTRKPDLFKCGVAGGPVIDWSYYEVMYTERYMDTPQTNVAGYKESCLVNYAGNLKGKLLQIHGTSDDVVVWQHSLLFQKACVDKNVQCDYYVYPGHLHNVRGKDRVNLLTKVSEYIIANT